MIKDKDIFIVSLILAFVIVVGLGLTLSRDKCREATDYQRFEYLYEICLKSIKVNKQNDYANRAIAKCYDNAKEITTKCENHDQN